MLLESLDININSSKMNKIKFIIAAILLQISFVVSLFGQNVVIVQPKIMVIPYTKEGQDLRTIL